MIENVKLVFLLQFVLRSKATLLKALMKINFRAKATLLENVNPASVSNSSGRLLELDALRGLAALSVLCFHYTTRYTEFFSPACPALFHFPWFKNGVQLFFIISGFVILMTLEKTKRPLDFFVSRFSRLYPCYWAAIALTFLVMQIFPLHLPGREVSSMGAMINLSMLQDWFGINPVDSVYWTLTIELSFYVVMSLVFIAGKLKYIEELGLGWLIFMIWNNRLFGQVHIHMPHVVNVSNLLLFGHLFFAGILFYNLKTKGNVWYRHVGLVLCLLVQYMLRDVVGSPITVAAFFIIFYLFIFDRLSWIVQKPLVYLGTISYSLYLTHQYIGFVIIKYLYSIHANAWVRFIVPMGFALLIATVITFIIERPMISYIRNSYKKWRRGDQVTNLRVKGLL
jgi:peptidoglycan/LPS O-acetylase OafA/YrhL